MLPFDLNSARSTSLRIFRESPRNQAIHISNMNLKYQVATPRISSGSQSKDQINQQKQSKQNHPFFQSIMLGDISPSGSAGSVFKNRLTSPLLSNRTMSRGNQSTALLVERMQRSRSEMIPSNHFSASEQFFSQLSGPDAQGWVKKTKKLNRNFGSSLSKKESQSNNSPESKEIFFWKQDQSAQKLDDHRPITRQFPKHLHNRLNSKGHFQNLLQIKLVDPSHKHILKIPSTFAENGISVHSYLLEHAKRENQPIKQSAQKDQQNSTPNPHSIKIVLPTPNSEQEKAKRKSKVERLKEIANFSETLMLGRKKSTFIEPTIQFKQDLASSARSGKSTKLTSLIFSTQDQTSTVPTMSKLVGGATPSSPQTLSKDSMTQLSEQPFNFGFEAQIKNLMQFDTEQPLSRYTSHSVTSENYDICEYVKDHDI